VQLKLGTRHKKDNLHKEGRNQAESTGCAVQSEVEVKQKIQIYSALRRVTSGCWGPIGPRYGLRKKAKKKEKKRRSANCVEGTLTEIGSKWLKKQKRRSEARENKSLDEKIEENRLAKKIDRGQLSKRKNPPIDALEHLAGKMERQAGEA